MRQRVILLALSFILGIFLVETAYASTSDEWHVIVMPYVGQGLDIGPRGFRGVFLYSYGVLEAVIDVNHNGAPDPGEPVINISSPGRLIYAAIGSGSAYKLYYSYEGDGPLWILVRRPILVSFFAYTPRLGYLGGYTMPPPGRVFVTPGLPGSVYIAAVEPGNTTVRIIGLDGVEKAYTISSSQYLVLNTGTKPIRIESDKPIVCVLVNIDNKHGNATYMTELVPLEKPWIPRDVSLPLPENLIAYSIPGVKSYTLVVSSNDRVYSVENLGLATLNEVKKLYGLQGPAVAYVLVSRIHGGIYAVDVAPVYNFTAWFTYLGRPARLITSYTLRGGAVKTLIDQVYLGGPGMVLIVGDRDRDFYGDIGLGVLVDEYSHVFLASRLGRVNVNTVTKSMILSYALISGPTASSMLLRIYFTPVPRAVDDWRDRYGARLGDVLESFNGAGFGIALVGDRLEYSIRLDPVDSSQCRETVLASLLLAPDLSIVDKGGWGTGCSLRVRGYAYSELLDRYKLVYIAGYALYKSHLFYINGRSIAQPREPAVIKVAIPVLKPYYVEQEGIHSSTKEALLKHGGYYRVSAITMPGLNKMALMLGVERQLTKTTTPRTKSTTSRELPATVSERSQTSYSRTTTHAKTVEETVTATRTHTSESTRASTSGGEAVGVRIETGDTLTYHLQVSGSASNGKHFSGSGTLKIEIARGENRLELRIVENTLAQDARSLLAIMNPVSDIFAAALLEGKSISYRLPSYTPFIAARCPIIAPDKDSNTLENSFDMLYHYRYRCSYSKGVLVELTAEMSGSYAGKSFSVKASARLKDTSIKGVEYGGGSAKETTSYYVSAGIAIALAVFIIAAARMRARTRS